MALYWDWGGGRQQTPGDSKKAMKGQNETRVDFQSPAEGRSGYVS